MCTFGNAHTEKYINRDLPCYIGPPSLLRIALLVYFDDLNALQQQYGCQVEIFKKYCESTGCVLEIQTDTPEVRMERQRLPLLVGRKEPIHAMWSKIAVLQNMLLQYDYVFLFDADSVMVNHSVPLWRFLDSRLQYDVLLNECNYHDGRKFNSNAIGVKNSEFGRMFLRTAYEFRHVLPEVVQDQMGFQNSIALFHSEQFSREELGGAIPHYRCPAEFAEWLGQYQVEPSRDKNYPFHAFQDCVYEFLRGIQFELGSARMHDHILWYFAPAINKNRHLPESGFSYHPIVARGFHGSQLLSIHPVKDGRQFCESYDRYIRAFNDSVQPEIPSENFSFSLGGNVQVFPVSDGFLLREI